MKRVLTLMVALALAACDSSEGPSGPGSITAEISAAVPLSAAVVQIAGPGITGARTVDAGLISGAPTGATASPGFRVVVFRNAPGTVRVSLDVEDIGADFSATVIEAADADGEVVAGVGGLTVSISR